MKKIILFFACLLLINDAYCQTPSDSTSKENFTKQYYFQKSKNQKTGAWVLISAGIAISGITVVSELNNMNFNSPKTKQPVGPKITIACIAGSIPLFIAAARNKRKGLNATAYFKMEKIPVLLETTINFQSYPAISVKLNF